MRRESILEFINTDEASMAILVWTAVHPFVLLRFERQICSHPGTWPNIKEHRYNFLSLPFLSFSMWNPLLIYLYRMWSEPVKGIPQNDTYLDMPLSSFGIFKPTHILNQHVSSSISSIFFFHRFPTLQRSSKCQMGFTRTESFLIRNVTDCEVFEEPCVALSLRSWCEKYSTRLAASQYRQSFYDNTRHVM